MSRLTVRAGRLESEGPGDRSEEKTFLKEDRPQAASVALADLMTRAISAYSSETIMGLAT